MEDICNLCYTFAHWTKYFVDVQRKCLQENNKDDEEEEEEEDNVNQLTHLTQNILDINHPESSATLIAEEREQMMLVAVDHIRMARAQQNCTMIRLMQQECQSTSHTVNVLTLLLLTIMDRIWSCPYSIKSNLVARTTTVR